MSHASCTTCLSHPSRHFAISTSGDCPWTSLIWFSLPPSRSRGANLIFSARFGELSFRYRQILPRAIAGRKKRGAYQNYVSIAMGSQGELETQVIICERNQLMTCESCHQILELIDRVGAMLYRLHDALES